MYWTNRVGERITARQAVAAALDAAYNVPQRYIGCGFAEILTAEGYTLCGEW